MDHSSFSNDIDNMMMMTTTTMMMTDEGSSTSVIFVVVSSILTALALTINIISLVVIFGFISDLVPPLQLLASLNIAQLLAAIAPHLPDSSSCQQAVQTSLLHTSHNATALTLSMLSACQSVATFRPFKYSMVLSKARVWTAVGVIWVTSFALGHVQFVVGAAHTPPSPSDQSLQQQQQQPFCWRVSGHAGISVSISLILSLLFILFAFLLYSRIIFTLHQATATLMSQNRPNTPRGIVTALIIVTGYTVSWIPYLITQWCLFYHQNDDRMTHLATTTNVFLSFVLVSCIANPLICVIRMDSMNEGNAILVQRLRTLVAGCRPCVDARDDRPSSPECAI